MLPTVQYLTKNFSLLLPCDPSGLRLTKSLSAPNPAYKLWGPVIKLADIATDFSTSAPISLAFSFGKSPPHSDHLWIRIQKPVPDAATISVWEECSSITVGSKIIRALEIIRVKKLISNAVLPGEQKVRKNFKKI